MLKFKTFSILALIFFFGASPILCAQIIKDDFRVIDDSIGGDNEYPDVEILESGEEIIVWREGRHAEAHIYGQAYDTGGISVDTNFKVSTYIVNANEYYPAISSYGDSLLAVWQSGYGQWLLSNGSQEGSSFSLQSGAMYELDVVISDSGFFVVWSSYVTGSGWDIFIKRFGFNGDSISSRLLVNDDGTPTNQYNAQIAMDNAGNFVVVWQDERNDNSDIYGQLFDLSGNKIDSNFLVNDDVGENVQYNPSCALDFEGNFVVVWHDYRDGNYNIYGQRFDASGDTTGLGGNFLINDDIGGYHYNASCAMDSAGNFVIVWEDYRNGNADVYGQRFDNTGASLGSNFRIDQNGGSENIYVPRVSMNENNFVVTWQDGRGETSIYKRRFSNDGTPVGDEVKVNELDGTENQNYPAIDMNASGNVVITWQDNRSPYGIYFQRLNSLGDKIGGNLWVASGIYPDVAVSDDSSFAITYNYNNNIYYQRFRPSGDSINSPAVISDTTYNSRQYPEIVLDSDNNAIITWEDRRTGNYDIYAQIVDSAGDTVGGNFKVNDDIGTGNQYRPAIATTPSGRFLITWYDYRNSNYDIYGQVYDSERNPIGSNFRIDSGGTSDQRYPDAGYLPDGNYIIVWQDNRAPSGVYAQLIDTLGSFIDTNFKVSINSGYEPRISIAPSGAFAITWEEYNNQYDIYAQKYNADFSPDSIIFKVNNETEALNPNQENPDVATNGNSIIFTWQDPKWQRGWDIAAKVFSWDQAGIEDVIQEGKGLKILGISSPILTGKEWLSISLDSPSNVDFQIINVAGIVASSKELTYTTPGEKRVDFDVSKLPCGPYFLSLKTDKGRVVKKTVVIR